MSAARRCAATAILNPRLLLRLGTATPSFSTSAPRYPTHVPLNPLQRAALALASSLGAAADPRRADLVAAAAEASGGPALAAAAARMRASPTGRQLLRDRPRVTDATLAAARACPPGSFGSAYAAFMDSRAFTPSERPPVRFVDDPDAAYAAARARECHDFWHVLFACPTTVAGELALKAVEFVQTGLPAAGTAVLGAAWRLSAEQRAWLAGTGVPWALRAGSRAADLLTLRYEAALREDLEVVRAKWRIMPLVVGPPARSGAAGGKGRKAT